MPLEVRGIDEAARKVANANPSVLKIVLVRGEGEAGALNSLLLTRGVAKDRVIRLWRMPISFQNEVMQKDIVIIPLIHVTMSPYMFCPPKDFHEISAFAVTGDQIQVSHHKNDGKLFKLDVKFDFTIGTQRATLTKG